MKAIVYHTLGVMALVTLCQPSVEAQAKEYIRVGGRVLAIESGTTQGNGSATVLGVSPPGGLALTQTFAFTFSSPSGYQSLTVVDVLINNSLNGGSACYFAVVPSGANFSVLLINDAGDAGGPYASMTLPGSGTVQNSQCSIAGSGSSVSGSGNNLIVMLAITFKTSFSGVSGQAITSNKVMYLSAQNAAGNSGWQAAGTWNVPGAVCQGPPCVVSVAPSHGTTTGGSYAFQFSDANGFADLTVLNVLVNSVLDGQQACFLAFVPSGASGGTVNLVNDAGNAGGPYAVMTLPGTASVQNGHCAISGVGSSVSGSGPSMTLTLNITFTNFSGNRVMYLAARNSGVSSGWQAVGSVAVP